MFDTEAKTPSQNGVKTASDVPPQLVDLGMSAQE